MPSLTNIAVVRALLELAVQGIEIPDRVIGFALEEDFSGLPAKDSWAMAHALVIAAKMTPQVIRWESR